MSAIFDFIMDNIAVLVGLLVLFSSVHSARKKKRKAAETENPPQEASVPKSFRQIMAEIESEPEEKPWDEEEEEPSPAERRSDRRRGKNFGHPYAAPAGASGEINIPVQAVIPEIPPLRPTERAAAEDKIAAAEKQLQVIKKKKNDPFDGKDLVKAVVMSEILDKPKALRRDETKIL